MLVFRTYITLFMDTVFWLPRGSLGSHSTSDPLITTAWVWWTLCPNFVLLATVVPEILTRLGGCDVITPLSFIISIDCQKCQISKVVLQVPGEWFWECLRRSWEVVGVVVKEWASVLARGICFSLPSLRRRRRGCCRRGSGIPGSTQHRQTEIVIESRIKSHCHIRGDQGGLGPSNIWNNKNECYQGLRSLFFTMSWDLLA